MTRTLSLQNFIDIEALAAVAAGRFRNAYVIYCRRSTDDPNNQQNSISYQEIENAKFARARGLPIADLTWPGLSTNGIIRERHSGHKEDARLEITADGQVTHQIVRPKFAILMQLIARRIIKGAVVLSWDRLSRNDGDSDLVRKLKARGADIQFRNAIYADSSSGSLHMSIDATFARYYSDTISEKVRDALRKMRNEGKCTYHSPIGYLDRGAANKVIDPDRAPVVREIFARYESGEWSLSSLAQWARTQGLTTKPRRRRRTREERLNDVEPGSIPVVAAAVSHKTIESILSNPFYIGKIRKFGRGRQTQDWMNGIHPPLISASTFQNVQFMLRRRNVGAHYPHLAFYRFRGLLKCACGRAYSPYVKKGITYYRSRCKAGCDNRTVNVNEARLDRFVKEFMHDIVPTADELRELAPGGEETFADLSAQHEIAVSAIARERDKLRADLEYLTREKWTLLRTGAAQPEGIRVEEDRLTRAVENAEQRLQSRAPHPSEMTQNVVSFTELINSLPQYYQNALDVEKHALLVVAFTELIFVNGTLKYRAREGFDFLLDRHHVTNGDQVPQGSVLPNLDGQQGQSIVPHLHEYHYALKHVSKVINDWKSGKYEKAA